MTPDRAKMTPNRAKKMTEDAKGRRGTLQK